MISRQTLPDHDARLRQAQKTGQTYYGLSAPEVEEIVAAYTDPNAARLQIEADQKDED